MKVMYIWRVIWLLKYMESSYQTKDKWPNGNEIETRYVGRKRKFFIKKYKSYDIKKLFNYALGNDYVAPERVHYNDGTRYYVDDKGYRLLDFPLGTVETIGREYGLAITFLVSAAIAIAGQWRFIEHLLKRLF